MTTEVTFALLIFVVLLALAVYFGRQQVQTLRWLRGATELPEEDRRYVRRQAWQRLIGCALLLALGSQVAAAYLFGLEERVRELGQKIQAQRERGEPLTFTAEEQEFRRFYGFYWIAALALLAAIVFMAAYDIWAIRRYGRRHLQQIHDERRAMLEGQVARLRSERNGHV